MFRAFHVIIAVLITSPTSFGSIISYDAMSGVLPSNLAIPPDHRFQEEGGQFGFSNVTNGVLTIHDTSTSNETKFFRDMPPVSSTTFAAFQIETKVISANRPNLNTAGEVGFLDGLKTVRIGLEPGRVGFVNRTGSAFTHSVPFNTTDGFHVYRVLKFANSQVQLFVDDLVTPILNIPYSQLADLSSGTPLRAHLWQGSNAGRSHVEIKSFAYNPEGLTVPEPSSGCLLLVAGFFLIRRRTWCNAHRE